MSIKKVFLPSFILLLTVLTLAIMPTEKDGAIYSDTLRLHILADSNSSEDQKTKIAIRDAVLAEYGEDLKNDGIDGAVATVENKLYEIEAFVNNKLSELGEIKSAKVMLGEEWYDTRVYESFTLPSGYYKSLRIVIGSGEGKNWWCVMYPPLCLDLASENAPHDDALINYTKEEISLIKGGKYNIKFKMLEIISSAFQK